MAADATAFLTVACETTMPDLWVALRALRRELPIARVYWHPDERFHDGRHFRIEVPVALLIDPVNARGRVEHILQHYGIHVVA